MKRISVALATYCGERFLDEQLESLAAQTQLPHELVICDDGSTDRTLEIAARFAQRAPFPVRIERNERPLGYGENFLRAASLCSGELIAFCDQDDVWKPHKLERCARTFTDPQVLLALHVGLVVDGSLRSLGLLQPSLASTRIASPGTANPWLVPPGFAMVIAADLIHQYPWGQRPRHPTSPEKTMPHDLWVYFLAGVLGKVALVAEPLCFYRQHESNTCGAYQVGIREKLGLMLKTQWQSYDQTASLANEYADFLLEMIERSPAESHSLLRDGSDHYREIANRFALRTILHRPDTRRGGKLGMLLHLLQRGDYAKSRDHGGLGWRSIGKDTVMALLG